MERNEVNACPNVLLVESLLDSISICLQLFQFQQDGVEMARVSGVFLRWRRGIKGKRLKGIIIALPDFFSTLEILFYSLKLMNAQSGLNIHHVVFKTRIYDAVVFESLI